MGMLCFLQLGNLLSLGRITFAPNTTEVAGLVNHLLTETEVLNFSPIFWCLIFLISTCKSTACQDSLWPLWHNVGQSEQLYQSFPLSWPEFWFYLFLGAQLILAPLGIWVRPPMNWYRMFFVQSSTPTPSMHQKLIDHGKFCMQNNQLQIKTLVELKDNYIGNMNFLGLERLCTCVDIFLQRHWWW
jgi:hypothetical protein